MKEGWKPGPRVNYQAWGGLREYPCSREGCQKPAGAQVFYSPEGELCRSPGILLCSQHFDQESKTWPWDLATYQKNMLTLYGIEKEDLERTPIGDGTR